MFAERFDALMNIAEVSNSLLGRAVSMNPSHIGRLRSGARSLPKKHGYIPAMCRYIAGHIRKDYQINALQKLTGIDSDDLMSPEKTAQILERWLLDREPDTLEATGRLISGFSRTSSGPSRLPAETGEPEPLQKYASYLYGNAGKRKAVEQFFTRILQEDKPQTLLLFSDENMAWLYEDPVFAAKWAELFTRVIRKGNRVKIIHTVSRDLNEMLEAVTRWIPVYMTGMIEPYCYPRLRDGIFRRTLFLAPDTAAVVSSSVQQDTEGMLNLFITDRAALDALGREYERYFALCRPLMRIVTARDGDSFRKAVGSLAEAEGDAFFCSAMPPLFAMPEELVNELSEQSGSTAISEQWNRSIAAFSKSIEKGNLTVVLRDPQYTLSSSGKLLSYPGEVFSDVELSVTKEQYGRHIENLKQLERKTEGLKVCFAGEFANHTLLYVKEAAGAIMAKTDSPRTAFIIGERNMVSAFWDYVEKCVLNGQPDYLPSSFGPNPGCNPDEQSKYEQ